MSNILIPFEALKCSGLNPIHIRDMELYADYSRGIKFEGIEIPLLCFTKNRKVLPLPNFEWTNDGLLLT